MELSKFLTQSDVEQILDLVNANELGIALENFCTQLYERDAVCSREHIGRICAIGEVMGIKPEYWDIISTTEK